MKLIELSTYRSLVDDKGWINVCTYLDDETYSSNLLLRSEEDTEEVYVNVKLYVGKKRKHFAVHAIYDTSNLSLVEDLRLDTDKSDDPQFREMLKGKNYRAVIPRSTSRQYYLRLAAVLGICPFSLPVSGFSKCSEVPQDLRIVGLDIETTSYFREGAFNLFCDPIICLSVSSNFCEPLFVYTTGYLDPVCMEEAIKIKVENSTELVRVTVDYILRNDPDFVCIHNGYNYDIPMLCFHAPIDYTKYFEHVNLGATSTGVDFRIPGITTVDTYFYLSKIHRSSYQNMTLDSISRHHGLPQKLSPPSMLVELSPEYNMTLMAEYNLHDAYLHWRIACEANCIGEISNLASTSKCPLSDAARYITGLMVTLCVTSFNLSRGKLMPWGNVGTEGTRGYKGAHVIPPVLGIHKNTSVLDFVSLYPSIMVDCNVSVDSLKIYSTDPRLGIKSGIVDWTPKFIVTNNGENTLVYDRVNDGTSRVCMKRLIARRSEVGKKTLEGWTLKVLANSCYGAYGAKTSWLYFKECAETVTCVGRWAIQSASSVFGCLGLSIIYGDTDSIFVTSVAQGSDDETLEEFRSKLNVAIKIYANVISFTPFNNLILELEDYIFERIIISSKKHYRGVTTDGSYVTKGMAQVRKSTPPIVRKFLNDFTNELLRHSCSIRALAKVVDRYVTMLQTRKVPVKDMCAEMRVDSVPCLVYVDLEGNRVVVSEKEVTTHRFRISTKYILERMKGAVRSMSVAINIPSLESLVKINRKSKLKIAGIRF